MGSDREHDEGRFNRKKNYEERDKEHRNYTNSNRKSNAEYKHKKFEDSIEEEDEWFEDEYSLEPNVLRNIKPRK